MKVDRDDAPEHIRGKRKTPIGLAGITAAGLILGIMFMADRNGWIDFARHVISPPEQYQQTATPSTPPAPSPKSEDLVWETAEAEKQKELTANRPVTRQTSFNDSNYQPKRIINTMPPPPQKYAQARSQPASNRQNQYLNGRRETTLKWEDNRQKRYWWKGPYRWNNSVINYDDLCRSSNFPRKGSIEYRACRRAAKTYLREECRAGRSKSQQVRHMYCHAESGFRH